MRRWWLESDRRVHVVGKGILRFRTPSTGRRSCCQLGCHSRRIQVHPYLTVDGLKLSKSSGRTVDPLAVVNVQYGRTLRWWFAATSGRWVTRTTASRLVERANDDLANGFGNVVPRRRSCSEARDGEVDVALC